MLGLVATFKAHDTDPKGSLFAALKKRWVQKTTMPLTSQALPRVSVSQVREVIAIFLEKMERGDWLTSHIGFAFLEKIPEPVLAAVEERYLIRLYDAESISNMLELLAAVDDTTCVYLDSLEDPKQPLMENIAVALMDDSLYELFEGILCEHVVHFIRFIKRKIRKLRESMTQNSWHEDEGMLTELPYVIVVNEDEAHDELGFMYDDDLVITTINEGPVSRSKLERGMRIVAIDSTRVHVREQVEQCLLKVSKIFEISVEIDTSTVWNLFLF